MFDTERGFTGQIADAATGLNFYNARYYDSTLGKFISPDSVVPNLYVAADLNRFVYVRNNPLAYIDPTGHECSYIGENDSCDEPGSDPNSDLVGETAIEPSYNIFSDEQLRKAERGRREASIRQREERTGRPVPVRNPGPNNREIDTCERCGNDPLNTSTFSRSRRQSNPVHLSKTAVWNTDHHDDIISVGLAIRPEAGNPNQSVSVSIHQSGPGGGLYGVVADSRGVWVGRLHPQRNSAYGPLTPGEVFEVDNFGIIDQHTLPDRLRSQQGTFDPDVAYRFFRVQFESLYYIGDF